MILNRFAPALLGLAWLAAPAAAQRDDDLAAALRVEAAADVRARAVVAYGDREATRHTADVLRVLFAAATQREDDAERCVALAALDGLVRAGARPSVAEALALAKLSSLYAGGVVRLLATDVDRYAPALIALADRNRIDDDVLDAVCRLAVRAKDRTGLAAMLLRRLHPRVTVIVRDRETPPSGLGGGRMASRAHGAIHVPGDFPAFGHWTMAERSGSPTKAAGDGEPIAPGIPELVARRRTIEPGKPFGFGQRISARAGDRIRMRALASLLDRDLKDVRAILRRAGTVDYRDDAQCRHEMNAIRAAAERGFSEIVALLRAKRLLTEAEARALKPRVDLRLDDRRGDRRTPCPDPTGGDTSPPPVRTVRIGAIDWWTDYDRALAHAKRVGKPLLLHFGENPG